MNVNSIQIINFGEDLKSADIIISTDTDDLYSARIHKIDVLLNNLETNRSNEYSQNYYYVPNTVLVEEINEDSMFDVVNNLLDDGDFHSVFEKI